MFRVLAINPGATSTKVAIFDGDKVLFNRKVEHSPDELKLFDRVFDQYEYRLKLILKLIGDEGIALDTLNAVVGRGGLLKPLPSGTYLVNESMLKDLEEARRGEHASNLGAVLANYFVETLNIPAFIVDPVSVDELEPVARISGLPEFERISRVHALNAKAVARTVAKDMGSNYAEVNFIVAHLGTGVSVAAHKRGRMIDVSNGLDEGAFSLDRCGGLPITSLVAYCYSGQADFGYINEQLLGSGGIYAYLGTKDLREVERLANNGDGQAKLLLEALAYQVAKEIGAMAAVLSGNVDRIILTGGVAYSARIVDDITGRVNFIAPVVVMPGEEEMGAMAAGALRVLRGEEQAKSY